MPGTVVAQKTVWLKIIDDHYRHLLDFLRQAKTCATTVLHLGHDATHGKTTKMSLLDVFETGDWETIEWKWIRERLASTAEIDGDKAGRVGRGLASTGEAARMMNDALAKADSRMFQGSDNAITGVQRVQHGLKLLRRAPHQLVIRKHLHRHTQPRLVPTIPRTPYHPLVGAWPLVCPDESLHGLDRDRS